MNKSLSLLLFILIVSFGGSAQELSSQYLQYVDSADYYLKKKDWEMSEVYLIKALKTEPANKSNYLLWSNLGTARMERGDTDGALLAFEIGLTTVPKSVTMLTNRARTYLQANRIDEAVADLETVLSIDSIAEFPLRMTAALALEKGDLPLAGKRYRTLATHYPKDNSGLIGLAKVSQIEGKFEEASKYYEEAAKVETLDEDSEAQFVYAMIKLNKLNEAKERLVTSLEKYPRCGNLYLMRGLIHQLQYQTDLAQLDRKLALEYGADPAMVNSLIPPRKK